MINTIEKAVMRATIIQSARESDGAVLKSVDISGLQALDGDGQRKAALLFMELAVALMPRMWPAHEYCSPCLLTQSGGATVRYAEDVES